jgi:DNA-binding transcriptional LysR family regulator
VRRIDFVTLRLFVAICEEGSLTRAALREAIAPSAVSKRLNELEAALRVALFERQRDGMTLTAAGQSLLHHARMTLRNVEKIAAELSEYAEGVRGHIRMFANLSAILEFLPDDLPPFFERHRSLRFDLEERTSAEVIRGVEAGLADLGICSADVEPRALQRFSYRRDRLVLVAPKQHRLAKARTLQFQDTLDFDHVGLFATSSIYLRCQCSARQAGKQLRLRVHVPGFDAVCRMVQAGMGVGLIPDRAFAVLGPGMDLVAIRLEDAWATRELNLVVRDPARLSASSRLMLEHLLGVND